MDGNNYNNNNQNGSSDSFYSYITAAKQADRRHANEGNVNQYNNSYQNTNSYSQTQDISRAVHIRMAHTRTQDISRTVLTRMVDIRIPTVHFIRTHSRLVKNKRKREKENRVDLERNLQNAQPSR